MHRFTLTAAIVGIALAAGGSANAGALTTGAASFEGHLAPTARAMVAPAVVAGPLAAGSALSSAELERVHYRGRRAYRPKRHFGRPYHRRHLRRHARPRVRIIERPCSTRIIRRTRRGVIERVIKHCPPRYGYRRY